MLPSAGDAIGAFRRLIQVYKTTNDSFSGLTNAIETGKIPSAKAILARKQLDLNAQTAGGQSLIEFVAVEDASELIPLMYIAGWSPETKAMSGWNALTIAVDAGALSTLRAILDGGANPNARNSNNMTAIMVAARQGKRDAVRMLHQAGAFVDLQDKDGWTALHWAYHKGQYSMIPVLLALGANHQIRDRWGQEPPQILGVSSHVSAC